jgi:uncharacterized protein (DUF2147 family)
VEAGEALLAWRDAVETIMRAGGILAAGLLWAAVATPASAQRASPLGTWVSQTGDTRIRLSPCGTQLCGSIVWVRSPGKDTQNSDRAQRDRDLVGIRIITMDPVAQNKWRGPLYNHIDGRSYNGNLTLTGQNTMELSGCVLGGFICRSQTWSRVN